MTGSKSKSESGSAQKWAQPYASAAASEVQGVYNANKDNLAAQVVKANELSDALTKGYGNAGAVGGDATKFYRTVLSGKYLDAGNPYLEGIVDTTGRNVMNDVNSQFTAAGRYGSGAFTDVMTSRLAEAENALRYANYSDEMQRMMDAAGGSVTADSARSDALTKAAAQALAGQAMAAELPYTGTNNMASSLGQLFNGGTQTQKSSIWDSLIGAAGSVGGAAIKASDPRLKENVVKLGEEPDGLGWYAFDYIWSGPRQEGVMADEVAVLRPWALGPEINGFMTVNYDMLEAA